MYSPCIQKRPPVLIDVGASGGIHAIWKPVAKHSICIAFEPDDRELTVSKNSGKGFREFYLINRVVGDEDKEVDFYFTHSPYCSSSLEPNIDELKPYAITSFFTTTKKIKLEAVTINAVLKNIGLNYIDWFKTDTQGTDLRAFSSISETILNKIMVAEFEPGIMNAYKGEDKLYKVMEFFNDKTFWCDECVIKGFPRFEENFKHLKFSKLGRGLFFKAHKNAAFWAEISYMNTLQNINLEKRDILLACVFSLLKKQYGFAIELAHRGQKLHDDAIFNNIIEWSLFQLKRDGYRSLLPRIWKKIIT